MAPKTRDPAQVDLGGVVPITAHRDPFPPRYIDFTAMPLDAVRAKLDELIEYSSIGPFTVRARVNAAFAAECLRRSTGNPRGKLCSPRMSEIARDIVNGRWDETLEPWKFIVTGAFRDAHTRAHALVSASKTVPSAAILVMVAFGAAESATKNMGSGEKWDPARVLNIPLAVKRAFIAAYVATNDWRIRTFSIDEIERARPAIEGLGGVHSKAPAPVWGVLISLHRRFPTQTTEFARQLAASAGEPIHGSVNLLREYILKSREDGAAGHTASRLRSLKSMTAVRAFIENKRISKLQVKDGESDDGLYGWFRANSDQQLRVS